MKRLALCLVATITFFNIAGAQPAKAQIKKELTAEQYLRLQSVRNVEQWVMGMRDDKILSISLAQIADLTWKIDEDYARGLMSYSLNRIAVGRDDSQKEVAAKNAVRRRVVTLVAKHDTAWAKNLIEANTKDSGKKAVDSILNAQELVDDNPKAAAELTDQSIQNEINQAQVSILRRLRRQSPVEADRLFQQMLIRCSLQSDMDANIFSIIGTYLFRSPRLEPDEDGIMFTRVGDIGMPDLTGNIPDIPATLIHAYLRATVGLINRPSVDVKQRQVKYALGYMMLAKAQQFAPNLAPEIVAAMAMLSNQVPAEFTSEDAYKYLTKKPSEPEDRIKEIEKTPDSATRDQLYLDMAFNALRKNNFESARLAGSKIEENSLQSELEAVIQFAEIKLALKAKKPDVVEAWRMTNKLPESLDKAMLWLALASIAEKAKDRTAMIENLGLARDTAIRVDDDKCPFLLLYIAGQLKTYGDLQSSIVLGEALKAFNKFENIKDPEFVHPVGLEMLRMRFPLDVTDVKIGFQESFFKAISGDADNAVYAVNDITDERLRGVAYVALTKILLERKLPSIAGGESDQVSEEVLRKSATKMVKPLYPAASIKKKVAGIVVAELQCNAKGDVTDLKIMVSPDTAIAASVEDALKQWKFAPGQLVPNKALLRGKITFSFEIDKAGKGEVKNPVPLK